MKHISLLSFLFFLSMPILAQEVVIDTSYYTPPALRRQVLTDDPDQNPIRQRSNRDGYVGRRELDRQRLPQVKEIQTWYAGAEGGFRNDGTTLTNSFNGLISSVAPTKSVWGILLGYTYRNAWAIETGYMHSPIHLNITVASSQNPLIFNYQNTGHGIPLRIKRRIGSGKQAANGTGFWLTAGAWLIPGSTEQTDNFKLIGYNYRNSRSRTADTIRINTSTTTVNRTTGLAELGVDYSARLSSFLELGFYVRKYWGFGNAIRSDMIYTVNKTSEQQSSITADGTGWGFGIALRYIYGRQQEVKKPLN